LEKKHYYSKTSKYDVGAEKMADHIQFMTGYYPNRWIQLCWKYISPMLIAVR